MDKAIARYREASSHLRGRAWSSPTGRRVRDAAVAQAKRMHDNGAVAEEVAQHFGVSTATVRRWLQTRGGLRPVTVVATPQVAGPSDHHGAVVVLPSGVRIEGLSVSEVVTLARALG